MADSTPRTAISWFRQITMSGTIAAQLHVAPTLWFCFPIAAFFVCVAIFLELYVAPLGAEAHLAVFAVGSYIAFSSYFVCDYFMLRNSSSYKSIPDDKKFYVLGNLIKSAVLFSYCPLASKVLYEALVNDSWNNSRIRNLGVLYAIPDFVSLFLVSRMSITTKIHHVCVVIFMVYNLYADYTTPGVSQALMVYGVFSTFSYLVNMLLASRFLQVSEYLSLVMAVVALVIYSSCLAINWTWQAQFLWQLWHSAPSERPKILLYCGFITMIVYDDCVLVQWLWQNVAKSLPKAKKGS